jgi:hypothetical protein
MYDRLSVHVQVSADADHLQPKKDRTLEWETVATDCVLDEIRLGPGSSRTLLADTNTTGDGHEYLFIKVVTAAASSVNVTWEDNSGTAREINIPGGEFAIIPRLRTGSTAAVLENNDLTDAAEVVCHYAKGPAFWED